MNKINWDVLKATLAGLLVSGGTVYTTLVAVGLSPIDVGKWLGIATIVVSVVCTIAPIILNAVGQTDAGKAKTFDRLDPDGKQAVLTKLQPETVLQAAKAMPEVAQVVVKDGTNGAVGAMAADPTETKVITESAAKGG